jgi:hypothetical protein
MPEGFHTLIWPLWPPLSRESTLDPAAEMTAIIDRSLRVQFRMIDRLSSSFHVGEGSRARRERYPAEKLVLQLVHR